MHCWVHCRRPNLSLAALRTEVGTRLCGLRRRLGRHGGGDACPASISLHFRDAQSKTLAFKHTHLIRGGIELFLVPLLFAIFAGLVWRLGWPATISAMRGVPAELITATMLATVVLTVSLAALRFPIQEHALMSAATVGVRWVPEFAARDLYQMMSPLGLLLISGVVAWWITILSKVGGTALLAVTAVGGGLIVLSPALYVARGFIQPLHGYEATEDPALHAVLRSIPRDKSLLISSDLADPVNYTQPHLSFRGFLLTAYEGHEFYVANIVYLNYLKGDAGERMANLHAFFGSPWSTWHERWLKEAGITHVIVHERCLPVWWHQREIGLSFVMARGSWSLFVPLPLVEAGSGVRPAAVSIPKVNGYARCL